MDVQLILKLAGLLIGGGFIIALVLNIIGFLILKVYTKTYR